MGEVDVYIVRIYRRDAAAVAGVVECVASGEQMSFNAMQELWNAIHRLPAPPIRGASDEPDRGDRE